MNMGLDNMKIKFILFKLRDEHGVRQYEELYEILKIKKLNNLFSKYKNKQPTRRKRKHNTF